MTNPADAFLAAVRPNSRLLVVAEGIAVREILSQIVLRWMKGM